MTNGCDGRRVAQEQLLTGVRTAAAADRRAPGGGEQALGQVRPEVLESWTRSRTFGVDPEATVPPVDLVDDALEDYRASHPLGQAMPVVRDLLVEHAASDEMIVAVSDAAGMLLWVEGDPAACRRAERMRFVAGARWDEQHAGTNAPGLALALGVGMRVVAAEHWARPVQPWSCSAMPVRDPVGGALLGALDVTGDERAASPGALALVRATAAAVERELLLRQHRDEGVRRAAEQPLRLSVLDPGGPTLSQHGRTRRVSLRHAELMLLLAEHPQGCSAGRLAVLLDERDLDEVTVRAELSRLRRVLGPEALRSRPYRLAPGALTTDVDDVRRALAAGDPAAAITLWRAPLLARSGSPGVATVRLRMAQEVRAALERNGDPILLLRWVEGPVAADDLALWRRCRDLLPAGPERDRAIARVRLLDRESR
ncbi:phytochrome sensor protein [Frankia sp. CcI49]|uniref:GAF domain-containing protein n=1 Tax=Frankia sp. CcI49 TaxID=1745382 RepID=UPI000978328E|nr:GAF domain-containing protein [Frankia sp. CcI49]ONH60558.1 phytochrome sensor protein [Frankia sp. CcI49]